ncbi:Cytoplasmic dynein 1 light intermediate chain 2 [Cichlidogyrus casuarinus]|uniref:Dynein light intermediate chain n=1 Tax=Cichlidogyrus casuarinus TaxID=1844966 RepID=A0ABD2PQI6_9PLAT
MRKSLSLRGDLLLLGDSGCGKTELAKSILGLYQANRGAGLELFFKEFNDEAIDTKLGLAVWTIDGNMGKSQLLKLILTENRLENLVVGLCLDLSRPWTIAANLQDWLLILNQHMRSLNLHQSLVEQLKSRAVHDCGETGPLPEGVLHKVFPFPLMFIVTKSEKSVADQLTEEELDFIQMQIRQTALDYGASVVYTSASASTNCSLLADYVKHLFFDFPFQRKAILMNPGSLFMQVSERFAKVEALRRSISEEKRTADYTVVIKRPVATSSSQHVLEITAEDDQLFLSRLQTQITSPSTVQQPVCLPALTSLPPNNAEKEAVLNSFFSSLLSTSKVAQNNTDDSSNKRNS